MMDNDDMSNNQMDEGARRSLEQEQYDRHNRGNNDPDYVGRRLISRHWSDFLPHPTENAKFQVLDATDYDKKKWALVSGPDEQGVIAWLQNVETMEKKRCHVVSNGLNGVKIKSVY